MIWLALLLAAAGPPDSETITVTARAPEDVRREAQAFVRSTGVADEPVARWVDPVCPQAIGVAAEIADRVERRVRQIGAQAGVRLANATCRSNLLIAFVHGGGDVVKRIAARSPNQFKDVDAQHRAYLYDGTAPIRWWHATQARTRDGMRDNGNDVPPSVTLNGPGGVPLGGDVHLQYRSSLASTQMIRTLRVATVIVDVDRAEGKSLDSVADFVALVGLAEIRPSDPPPPASVLSLFVPEGPNELTALDRSFLTTLYKLPLDRTAMAHRGLLIRGLVNGERAKAER